MTANILNLDGWDIEELEEEYCLELTKVDKGYLVESNAGVIGTIDILNDYLKWYEAEGILFLFDEETEEWDDMTDDEQEYYEELKEEVDYRADKLF